MRRTAARLVAVAGLVAGLLGTAGTAVAAPPARDGRAAPPARDGRAAAAGGLAAPPGARRLVAEPAPPSVDHVVVVGIAGLRWTDVSHDRTPTLADLAGDGSVGSMSVRTAPSVTCAGEGWLTVGAGTYAAVEDPGGTKASRGCGPRKPPPVRQRDDGGAEIVTMPLVEEVNHALRFGAQPGLLGGAVRCASAVGPGGAFAVADESGYVAAYEPTLPDDPRRLFARCPLTAVDLGALPDRGRDRALAAMDEDLATVRRNLPPSTVLIVAGIAETDARRPRLHVAVVSGNGFDGGWLHSASTRREPYVQLVDLAPTAMVLLGEEAPEAMAGRPLVGGGDGRPRGLAGTTRVLADTDRAAVAQRDVLGVFFSVLGLVSLFTYGALVWLLRRRKTAPRPAALRWLGHVALGLAAVPAATFAANLVPWWRTPWPALVLTALVAAMSAATALLAHAGPWRRWAVGPVVVVCAVTTVVTLIDGVTGANLQINSMLGYNPLVAGRFVGFGNIAFAAFGAAVMLLAALLAHGRPRHIALAIVAAVAIPTVVVDGAPDWGADFGGVLTFVPAFGILALLVARARINLTRLVLAGAAGVALVTVIGVLDYLRPAEARSHFGRFVASVLDGSAGTTVYRKIMTSVDLLLIGPHTVLAMVLVVWLAVLVFRPTATLSEVYERVPPLRTALVSVVVLSAIGFGTNDSSVAIPVVAGMVALPAVFAVCAAVIAATPRDDAGTAGDTRLPEAAEPTEVLP